MVKNETTPSDDERFEAFQEAINHLEQVAGSSFGIESESQIKAYRELALKLRNESERPKPSNFIDVSGMVFGRLTVLKLAGTRKHDGRTMWLCRCECGNNKEVSGKALRSGNTSSCGCICKELASRMSKPTHGDSKSAEFKAWSSIKERCSENSKDKRNYFDRGIKVCDRWIESYQNFLEDMGRKPSQKHSIERKNNDGNYEPDNCVWATVKEQANNRRTNRFLTHNGITLTTTQWAEKLGMLKSTVRERLNRGWSVEKALTTPVLNPR